MILPALYPALIGMLLTLILRGVAFEFRLQARGWQARGWGRKGWDFAFFVGSTLAALCQGLALGGLLQGIRVMDDAYAGGWWDWLTPSTMLCGIGVVVGYAHTVFFVLLALWDAQLRPVMERPGRSF